MKENKQQKENIPSNINIFALGTDKLGITVEFRLSRNINIAGRTTQPNTTKEIWKGSKIELTRVITCSGLINNASNIVDIKKVIEEMVSIEKDMINEMIPAP